jgi:hypothetical protein
VPALVLTILWAGYIVGHLGHFTATVHAQEPNDIIKGYCQQGGKIAKLIAQGRDAGITRATAIGDVVAMAERDFVNRPADCQSEEEVEMRADVGWIYAHPKTPPATCQQISFENCMKYHGPNPSLTRPSDVRASLARRAFESCLK